LRLALLMHRPDVDALLDELGPEGLTEWRAYLEGVNEIDGWRQSTRIEATIANGFQMVAGAFAGGGSEKPIRPDDLMPRFLPPETKPAVQTDGQMLAMLRASVGG
jgi:hypothetical protein